MGRWPSAASDGRANVRQDRKYCLVWRPEIGWCWMVPGSDATWPVRSFVIRASDKRSAFCAEASPAGKRCADGGGAGTGVAVMIAGASLKTDRQAAHQLSPVMGSPAWRDCHEQGLFGLARIAFGSHGDLAFAVNDRSILPGMPRIEFHAPNGKPDRKKLPEERKL